MHTLEKSIYEYLNTYELFDLSRDRRQENDLAHSEPARLSEMRSAYDRWLDAELRGKPDLLAGIPHRGGGWWTHGINWAFYKEPRRFFENEAVKDSIVKRLGSAAVKYCEKLSRGDPGAEE